MLEATDRVLLKTVIRAWLTTGMNDGVDPEKFATDIASGVVAQAITPEGLNGDVIRAFMQVFEEVGNELIAETGGCAGSVNGPRDFKDETSTARHPNFD